MPKRFVYFDLGNVLIMFDHQIAVEQLAQLAQRSPAAVRSAVFDSDLQTRYETGLIDGAGFTEEVNQRLGTELAEAHVLEAISAIFHPHDAMLPTLKKLKLASIPMGILSNTCHAHWSWLIARNWPILGQDWFEATVLSYEVQSMKPNAGIYEASESKAACSGNQIFFTDDRADNIAAATQRGWTTYQFGSIEGLLTQLDNWLLSQP